MTLAETTDKLTRAILHSVVYVACKFESGKAVLLPQVCNEFHKAYELQPDSQNEEHILDTAESTIKFKSKWFQLICIPKCVQKKLHDIVKTGGDLLAHLGL